MVDVPGLAATHNGHATWTFSQSGFNTWRHYRTMGICAALSVHWIKEHADGGSLANLLGSGGVGELNVAKLKEIALLHSNASNGDGAQNANLELWLQMHDILSLRSSRSRTFHSAKLGREVTTAQSFKTEQIGGAGGVRHSCPNIANEIVDALRKYNTCYARVNFGGDVGVMRLSKDAGHAVAVWLGQPTYSSGGDAMFFDPNYGEYWFEQKADFFRFFPAFYRQTYLAGLMNFDQYWEVLPCAKRHI